MERSTGKVPATSLTSLSCHSGMQRVRHTGPHSLTFPEPAFTLTLSLHPAGIDKVQVPAVDACKGKNTTAAFAYHCQFW